MNLSDDELPWTVTREQFSGTIMYVFLTDFPKISTYLKLVTGEVAIS